LWAKGRKKKKKKRGQKKTPRGESGLSDKVEGEKKKKGKPKERYLLIWEKERKRSKGSLDFFVLGTFFPLSERIPGGNSNPFPSIVLPPGRRGGTLEPQQGGKGRDFPQKKGEKRAHGEAARRRDCF